MQYDDDTDTLIRSDIEELRGDPQPVTADDGQLKALVLDFALPSSSYATMALREVLKADTSAAHQCQLQKDAAAKRKMETDSIDTDETEASKKLKIEETDKAAEPEA